jgi:aerobic carbon-monoxide dehydrogenase medium subunit
MKPAAFEYFAPQSVEEAVSLLAEHGDDAKIIAGGQSLVPMMAFRLVTPNVLVDLNGVSALEYHRLEGDTLVMGAMTRHHSVEVMPGLRDRCPMLAEAVSMIGHAAIRNRGTVGGSIAHADPSAEWPALALALDGEFQAVGPNGSRTIPAREFFVTYFTNNMMPDEILTEVRLRLPDGGRTGSAFLELARRHGDFAIAGVGALLALDAGGRTADVRITLTGVKETATRSPSAEAKLKDSEPTDEALAAAAEAIDEDIEPLSDLHGSSDYRRHVTKVLARRALARARARARGEEAA